MSDRPQVNPASLMACAAVALLLAGCAGERFSGLRNPFAGGEGAQVAGQSLPAPGMPPAGGGVPVAVAPASASAPAPAASLPDAQFAAAPPSPPSRPSQRATDVPVGAGVDVPPGGNEDFIVNVGRRVFFTEGSAVLTPIARETLDSQAAWLNRYPRWNAKIQGFADDPGSDAANLALGKQRADAVMNYLVARGVPAARLRAKTYGRETDRLVRNCSDISCKAQNRRVITNIEQR